MSDYFNISFDQFLVLTCHSAKFITTDGIAVIKVFVKKKNHKINKEMQSNCVI